MRLSLWLALAFGMCIHPAAAQEEKSTAAAEETASAAPDHSLLFTEEEIRAMKEAIGRFGRNQKASAETPDLIEQLQGTAETAPSQSLTYPQFYLNAIQYTASDNWTIWLNEQKISYDTPNAVAQMEVLAVEKSRVRLRWKPENLSTYFHGQENAPGRNVSLDEAKRAVAFTLYPNQTFLAYTLSVIEGKTAAIQQGVSEKTASPEETAQDAKDAKTPAAENQTPEPPPSTAIPSQNREGLDGLLERYQEVEPITPSQIK